MHIYYKTLGLQQGATVHEIKRAYRKYAKKFHPDKHDGDEFFKERFQEIQEAYEYLISHLHDTPIQPQAQTSNPVINFHLSEWEITKGDYLEISWSTELIHCMIFIDTGVDYFEYPNLPSAGGITVQIIDFCKVIKIRFVAMEASGEYITADYLVHERTTTEREDEQQANEPMSVMVRCIIAVFIGLGVMLLSFFVIMFLLSFGIVPPEKFMLWSFLIGCIIGFLVTGRK